MLRLVQLTQALSSRALNSAAIAVAGVPQMDFSKWSKPVKQDKKKERRTGVAISDEKAAKLSQSESEVETKRLRQTMLQKKMIQSDKHIRTQNHELDQSLSDEALARMLQDFVFRFEGKKIPMPAIEQPDLSKRVIYSSPDDVPARSQPSLNAKIDIEYFNCEDIVNAKFVGQIKPVEITKTSRRCGVLGYKLGMTSIWDKWGKLHPLTVIQVDRCQVVQVKTEEKEGFNAIQLGSGDKSLKRVNKPSIGHFMKSDIPPKKDLREFRVSKDCLLPAGYMMSVRHFTPGQFIDVQGTSIGKGFQGTIKRWNFKMGDATHGNSLSHRSPGSTGQRQDPGRVFKDKKMSGHMGNRKVTSQSLQVYKIDVENSLLFIRGHVPGNPGSLVQMSDALKKIAQNEQYLNFPTFIKGNEKLANVLIMDAAKNDPFENYIHDNDVID